MGKGRRGGTELSVEVRRVYQDRGPRMNQPKDSQRRNKVVKEGFDMTWLHLHSKVARFKAAHAGGNEVSNTRSIL